jgi:hypothetical protein
MAKHVRPINRKITSCLALTALLIFATMPSLASSSGDQTQNTNQNYEIPENTLQYNRTNTVPIGQMEQIRTMENYAFNYRNLTLMLNCTRNCELNITADPTLNPKILSLSIEPSQNMSLKMNISRTSPQAEMTRTQTLNFYLGLEPNATLELQAQIRLRINQTELNQELNREVNVSRLTWQYYNTTEHEWITVPSWINQNNYLECNTTHFSTWTISETSDQTGSQTETPPTTSNSISPAATINPTDNLLPSPDQKGQNSLPTEYLYVGTGVALAIAAAIGILAIKRRKP